MTGVLVLRDVGAGGECYRRSTAAKEFMSEETSELAEQGNEIFERVVRPEVDVEDDAQKFVVIDVESEDYEVDPNARAAFDRLIQRRPDARGRTWLRRVGSRQAYHFGGRPRETSTE